MSKIVVIIPTYNERETMGVLIDELESEFRLISKHQMWILIVDGNSPDGTAEAARQKKKVHQNINLIIELRLKKKEAQTQLFPSEDHFSSLKGHILNLVVIVEIQ